jgi:RHS repeat-associated protein
MGEVGHDPRVAVASYVGADLLLCLRSRAAGGRYRRWGGWPERELFGIAGRAPGDRSTVAGAWSIRGHPGWLGRHSRTGGACGRGTGAQPVNGQLGHLARAPTGIKAVLCSAGNLPCPGTLPTGVKWRLTYNQSQEHIDFTNWGHVVSVSDRYGNTLTAGYTEGIGQITSWTDTQGRKMEYFRGSSNRSFTEVKDVAGGRHVSYEYEGSGASQQLIAYTDASGNTTHYHYESYDLTKITTPKGNVTKLTYDGQHRIHNITRTTNGEHTTGPTTKFTYYALGSAPAPCTAQQKATVVTDPDGVPGESTPPVYSSQFGSTGSGAGQFKAPKGIALDGKGDVIVADEENSRVDVFKENGEFVKSFGSFGSKAGQFDEVKGVAADSKGNIWAVDQGNNWVEKFNEKGEYIETVGSAGSGSGQLKEPKGIAIDAHNNVWITDYGNNRVEEFNEKGEFVRTVGAAGSGNGQFSGPRELAVDHSGYLWVSDGNNNRVEEFNEKGEFLKTFGSLGTGNGQFKEPKGIVVDAQNNVWVTDAENNRIEKFNGAGEYETQFGSEGTEHGQFREPWGIQVNAHGEVFVSDTQNNRIEKFAPAAGSEAGHTETYCANVLDEVEKAVDAEGHERKVKFDPFGNVTTATSPAHETGGSEALTSFIYGTGGQNLHCEVQTDEEAMKECPAGALEKGFSNRYAYGDTKFAFQPSEAVSARQKVTKLCYWERSECKVPPGEKGEKGELKQQTDALPSQNTQNYSYGEHGEIVSSTDPDGHKTTYEYDSSGNLKTVTPPSGSGLGKETITVDADSRPHTVTQCLVESGGSCTSSETATLTYDKLDRVTEAVDTGPGATKTFKYTYDADGNLEKRVDPTGTTKFTLDPLNRLTEESLPNGASNAYAYDEASNLRSLTDAGGTTHYFYNLLNQLEATYEPGGNCGKEPSKCTRAVYDGAGSLSKITYSSGATLNYTVDPIAGRPTAITAKSPSGETLLSNSYNYRSGVNDTPLIYQDAYSQPGTASDTTTYEYDALDRLREAKTTGTPASYYAYELDGAGNRTSQDVNISKAEAKGGEETFFEYNAGNELECRMKTNEACSKSSSSEISGYAYDGAGNETAITGYNDPASTSFSYNNLNQLKSLTPPSSSEESVTDLGSGQSNLVALGSNTLQNSTPGLTKQVNEAGTTYYARTPGGLMVDERLPGGTSYNPIYDAQGDVIGLLNSSGALVQSIRYGPYGENTKASGSASYSATNDAFLFQGGYHLAGGNAGAGNVPNSQYHYGERYYDPTTGRWTQPDPASASTEYGFVGGDPINATDEDGEDGAENGYCTHSRHPAAQCYKNAAWRKAHHLPDPGTPRITGKDVVCTLAGGAGEIFGVGILTAGVCIVVYP